MVSTRKFFVEPTQQLDIFGTIGFEYRANIIAGYGKYKGGSL
jgi:hypothetical protein